MNHQLPVYGHQYALGMRLWTLTGLIGKSAVQIVKGFEYISGQLSLSSEDWVMCTLDPNLKSIKDTDAAGDRMRT